ncbi:MAG: hypothetical protein SPK63_01960 [Eubacteriales bacterium]|nr:hypothetical protein [Eubacteriales bacterium]
MITLNLETETKEQEIIKDYLENNVSEVLADKINNGVKIIKDNKTLLNKKSLSDFMQYACEEARKLAEKGLNYACIEDKVLFGWAIHYFEEDSLEGTLYNDDGTEYKKIVKTEYKPPVAKVEIKKKPENEQANFLDMFNNQNKQEEIEEVEEDTIEEKKPINPLTIKEKQSLVDIFDEPELEEELKQLKEQDEKEKQINLDKIDIKTGELLQPMTTNSNKYIAILQELLDNKLEVLL